MVDNTQEINIREDYVAENQSFSTDVDVINLNQDLNKSLNQSLKSTRCIQTQQNPVDDDPNSLIRINERLIFNMASKEDILMKTVNRFYTNTDNLCCYLDIVNGISRISLRLIDWFVTNYAKKNNTSFFLYENEHRREYFIVHKNYKEQLKSYQKTYFDPFCRQSRIIYCCNIPKKYKSKYISDDDDDDDDDDDSDEIIDEKTDNEGSADEGSNNEGSNNEGSADEGSNNEGSADEGTDDEDEGSEEEGSEDEEDADEETVRISIQTTVGQLNFFKWAIDKEVIKFIEENYDEIDRDMNDSTNERYKQDNPKFDSNGKKIRKKRTELSTSATKSVCRHNVPIHISTTV
jgi:hypothetical protein